MKSAIILVACVALASAMHTHWSPRSECHGHPSPDAKPNMMPILTGAPVLVKSVPNGKLYTVGSGDDTIPVVHVWGTPYQKGFAHGQLMSTQAQKFVKSVWAYMEAEVEKALNGSIGPIDPKIAKWIADVGLDVALDITSDLTAPFTGKYFFEEMHGLADGGGVDYDTIRRVHMVGELTKGRCSMFGAWGKATPDNGILTMRAFDWDVEGPFKDFSQVTVYHAQNSSENTFLNLGWTGWVASLSGVSDQQMSVHQIGASFPDSSFGNMSVAGVPFTHVLRDVLQFDKTRLDGLSRLASSRRTSDQIMGIGSGKDRMFNSVEYSYSVCKFMDDKNLRPVADWHKPIDSVVYHGMDWLCPPYSIVLHDQLMKYYGNLTGENSIRYVTSITQTGDLHVYVTELVKMVIWFAHAAPTGKAGPKMGYDRSFIRVDMNALFAVPPPTKEEYTFVSGVY